MGKTYDSNMKRFLKFIALVSLLFAVGLNGFSQYKKNIIVLELAGKSYYYFDLCYERFFSEKLHFGLGAGMGEISTLYLSPDEQVYEYNLSFPIYGGYTFGQGKHRLNTELGVSIFGEFFPGEDPILEPMPFISGGYELRGAKFIFRIPVYLTYVGVNEFFPAVMPWAGLSIGRLF